jgi:cold shock protein
MTRLKQAITPNQIGLGDIVRRPKKDGAQLQGVSNLFAKQDDRLGGAPGTQMEARVKWFNADKGFGFVTPINGSPDAFLHVSSLARAGLKEVSDGAKIVCEVGHGPKGPQVLRVIAVDASVSPPRMEPAVGPELKVSGAVKWFRPEKGFGFVMPDDGGKDVFVHKSVLKRCGIESLAADQRVEMIVQSVAKGREATWVATIV